MVKCSFLYLFVLLLLVACSRSQPILVDSQEEYKQWKNSLTYEDLVSCNLKHLNMGDRLDTLLSCVFEKPQEKVFCSESNNKCTFSLTDEPCEKEGMVCIRTSKYLPDDKYMRYILLAANYLIIKKNKESFDIGTDCGDFKCEDVYVKRVDFCINVLGINEKKY